MILNLSNFLYTNMMFFLYLNILYLFLTQLSLSYQKKIIQMKILFMSKEISPFFSMTQEIMEKLLSIS